MRGATLDELADLTEKIKAKGVEDLVLDPQAGGLSGALSQDVLIRRLALKKNFRPLGFPTIRFPHSIPAAAQAVSKYAGFVVLDSFAPELVYPLAGAAPEYLHRPAETDPGAAGAVRDQQSQCRNRPCW